MAETRKLNRRNTDTLFCVYNRADDEYIGCLVDMTAEGIRLKTMAPMETNVVFQFRMDLPEKIGDSAELTFDAESIWCNECVDSREYHVGFQLQNVPETEIVRIEQLIHGPLFRTAETIVHITVDKKTS